MWVRGGRDDYRQFLMQPTPRAYALASNGAWGWAAAIGPDEGATRQRALANSAAYGGTDCQVYAQDLAVVWPEGPVPAPVAPAAPLAAGPGWSLVPDGRFLWQGAQAARGAYLWAHGRAAAFARLAPRTAALLLLDRPVGLEGHGAGGDGRFTLRYAACLLDFAEGRRFGC